MNDAGGCPPEVRAKLDRAREVYRAAVAAGTASHHATKRIVKIFYATKDGMYGNEEGRDSRVMEYEVPRPNKLRTFHELRLEMARVYGDIRGNPWYQAQGMRNLQALEMIAKMLEREVGKSGFSAGKSGDTAHPPRVSPLANLARRFTPEPPDPAPPGDADADPA